MGKVTPAQKGLSGALTGENAQQTPIGQGSEGAFLRVAGDQKFLGQMRAGSEDKPACPAAGAVQLIVNPDPEAPLPGFVTGDFDRLHPGIRQIRCLQRRAAADGEGRQMRLSHQAHLAAYLGLLKRPVPEPERGHSEGMSAFLKATIDLFLCYFFGAWIYRRRVHQADHLDTGSGPTLPGNNSIRSLR